MVECVLELEPDKLAVAGVSGLGFVLVVVAWSVLVLVFCVV